MQERKVLAESSMEFIQRVASLEAWAYSRPLFCST